MRHERRPPAVERFPTERRRSLRGRPAVGAVITLVVFLGSLLAATLGSVAGDHPPVTLLLLLTLIRG